MTSHRLFLKPSKIASPSAMRFALLTMTALVALPVTAHAQFYWPSHRFDDDDAIIAPAPPPVRPVHRETPRRHTAKAKTVIKDVAKPQGPLLIAISIDDQALKIYDNNGLFAQTPVSTGMRGHATPMGVFSVLAKEKYHRSNIYSNAPMPYMQRITWSGVAMHAGVLPGYPASHGCIRMPMNFAVRMYGWTRNGARVVIAPGELMPTDISHPLLFTHRPEAPKTVAAAPANPAISGGAAQAMAQMSTPKSDKDEVAPAPGPAQANANDGGASAKALTTEPLRTADASGTEASLSVNDAGPRLAKDQTRPADSVPPRQTANAADAKPGNVDPAVTPSPASPTDAPAASPPSDPAKTAPAPRRWGHIAAFISRKEGKLFVRQNFDSLFESPVVIADGAPLGTHIFTMRASKEDPKTFQWSVVSMPRRPRAETIPSRKKSSAGETVNIPAAEPAEALDRIKIPDDAMQRLAELFAPGDSITVSDLGLGDETGSGTDFIVPLR